MKFQITVKSSDTTKTYTYILGLRYLIDIIKSEKIRKDIKTLQGESFPQRLLIARDCNGLFIYSMEVKGVSK